MYKGPVGQYTNYIDEGMERANDSQSVKCFYCRPPRADPLTPFDDPQAKGHLSWGQRALPRCWPERSCYGNDTKWQGVAFRRRGVTVDVLGSDVMLLDLFQLNSEAAGEVAAPPTRFSKHPNKSSCKPQSFSLMQMILFMKSILKTFYKVEAKSAFDSDDNFIGRFPFAFETYLVEIKLFTNTQLFYTHYLIIYKN